MPGTLGYKTSRNITLFSHEDSVGLGFESGNKTFQFNIDRNLTNLDYAHIRSVVDYNERHDFHPANISELNDIVTVYNHGALSTWHQLNHRPDFVKAFKAITELKKRFR